MTQRFPPAASQHPVHSETLPSRGPAATPPRHGKESAVIRRATLRKQRGAIERTTAWFVLVLSVIGSIAALAGGFIPLINNIINLTPQWSAIIGGFMLQVLLTHLEWHYFDTPMVAWPARVVDMLTTAIGYGPLVIVALSAFLLARGVPLPLYAAWGIIGIVSFIAAYYPESRLVE